MTKITFFRRFLATILLLAGCTITWAHDFRVDLIWYDINSDGTSVTVTGLAMTSNNYSVVIPSTVTHNGQKYSVTMINNGAFYNCSGLTSVTIPNSVTSIYRGAFSGCSGLTSVTIPNSVEFIADYAFGDCDNLTSVTINSNQVVSEKHYSFSNFGTIFGSQVKEYILGDDVTSIGDYAFYGCSGLTSFTIPNTVTSIGENAFYGCDALTSIIIPNTVTRIGDKAFSGCSGLTSVTINSSQIVSVDYGSSGLYTIFGTYIEEYIIGDDVTSIGEYAFRGCSGLTSVTIGNSVTSIGNNAFYRCSGLTSVTINSNEIVSKTYTYDSNLVTIFGSQVKEYIIGEGVTSIGENAFCHCDGLSVTIPNSVTTIGACAFDGYLTKAEFASMESLCRMQFEDEYSNPLSCADYLYVNGQEVKDLVIPSSVKSIGDYAFCFCDWLTSVTIPNSVTSISWNAFSYCANLTSVTINSNAIVSENQYPSSILGTIFGSQVKEYIIGDDVTSIGDYAFCGLDCLTSVTIGNSVTSIGEYAFFGLDGLTSVTIGNSVTSIGYSAFSGCGLTSITFPKSVTDIDGHAFSGCTELTRIRVNGEISCDSYAFSNMESYNIMLYVPSSYASWYRNNDPWSELNFNVIVIPDIGQVFTLVCKRGCVGGSGDGNELYLGGKNYYYEASEFVVVAFQGNTYLYDTGNKAFVVHTTKAQAGLTGNRVKENNNDLDKAVTGLKWGETGIDDYPFYLEDGLGNWLNMDGNGNVCMNTWKDFEGGLGGNTYLVTIVDMEFDDSEAIAKLEKFFIGSVTLDKTCAMLAKTGETVQLSATLIGPIVGETVTWRSGNPAVASVSNTGLVTAVAKGSADIYATSASGKTTEEPCHIIVNLADVSELSNTKQYYLHTYNSVRGSLGFANGALATTYSNAQAHKCDSESPFAIIKSGNIYYLYNIVNSRFINSNGDGTSSLTSDDAWTLTQNSNGLFMLKVAKTGKVLNVNWKEGIVINNWTTSDDGNQFVIEEAEDFDPTDALEKLSKSHYSQTPVQSISELDNRQVYTASTARANWYVPSGGTQMESTASPSAVSKTFTDSGQLFAIIKNEDKYYIYCVGEKKILNGITNNSPNRGMLVTEECQPVSITETGNADYPLFFSFGNNYNVNINGERNVTIDSWSTLDVGNRVALQPVWGVTLAEDELADILNCINTGISSISELFTDTGGICYDISGRRVSGIPGKGLYIVNGKKLMIK
ncbi:MAG: leucine-rich repeat protein [Bacteroidaceae bacterium]|nr:leucine-rich repeat protein [Bacteroidaceae bacterium]